MTSTEVFVTMDNMLSDNINEEHESDFTRPEKSLLVNSEESPLVNSEESLLVNSGKYPLVTNPIELDCEKIKCDTGGFTSSSKEDNDLFIEKDNLSQNENMHSIDLTDVEIVEIEREMRTNIEASNGVSSYVVDGNREVSKVNVDNKLCHDTILNFSMTEKGNELISVDLTASNGETSDTDCKESSILLKSPQISPLKNNNSCDTFEMDFAITPDENGNKFIKPLDTEKLISNKQNVVNNNSEKCNQHSIIILRNLMKNSTKGNGRRKQPNRNVDNKQLGTEKLQSVKVCNGSNSIINESNSIINSDERVTNEQLGTEKLQNVKFCNGSNSIINSDGRVTNEERPCFKKIPESVNLANESNSNFILYDKETSCQDLRMLHSSSQTAERKRIELEKECETAHEDSDISIVYDSKKTYAPKVMLTSDDDSSNEKNSNPSKKIYKEIDNELGILRTKHLDMERKLSAAATIISKDVVHLPISKMKEELTSFKISLERLKDRFRKKWLHAESEISNEQSKPSCSYQQDYEETNKTQLDKYTSEEYTVLRKESHTLYNDRELHHSYKHTSQLSTQEKDEMSDKYRQNERHLSFKMGTYREMDKKELSDYDDDEPNFKLFPEEKIQNCSKSLLENYTCFKKKTVGSQSERESQFCNYANKQDYAQMRRISKSCTDEKEISVKLDPRKYTSHKSLLSRSSTSLSSTDENNHSSPVIRTRKKISTRRLKKVCKLPKYDSEHDFSSDTSDFSQTSTDAELTPIYLESTRNRDHHTHLKKILKYLNSVKKNKLSSAKKKIRKSKYEKGTFHMNSSDSDFYHSIEGNDTCSRKRHKKYSENKRICNLITRQLNTINEHVSRKDDLMTFVKNSCVVSNIINKYNEDNDLNEEKFKDEINMASTPEYSKRKYMPKPHARSFKLAKDDKHADVHNHLKKKHKIQNYETLQSSDITPSSPSMSILSMEEKIKGEKEMKYFKKQTFSIRHEMKEQNGKEKNYFDQKKFESESYRAKLQSIEVTPSSSTSVSLVEKRSGHKKETNNFRKETVIERHQMNEQREKENYFEQKKFESDSYRAKLHRVDITPSSSTSVSSVGKRSRHKKEMSNFRKETVTEQHQMNEQSEKEFNNIDNKVIEIHNVVEANENHGKENTNVEDMEVFLLALKKKKLENASHEKFFNVVQEHKLKASDVNKIHPKNTLMQESQQIKTDFGNSKIASHKLKSIGCKNPKIPLEETERRSVGKKMKKQNSGNESRSLTVYNSSLDLFKQLNREIQKKK